MLSSFLVAIIGAVEWKTAVGQEVACYHCISLNYRNPISSNDPLPPRQNSENLTEIFKALEQSGVKAAPLSDSCADVSLTEQPVFYNTPVEICRSSRSYTDKCAKMTFMFKGEKIVIRNCLSKIFHDSQLAEYLSEKKGYCPKYNQQTRQ
ncbi:hypothetical protein WR25_21104 [Diploscapter pachys]|uniref:Saposin B-type domain-containing protein n=1 Tax=Diploscapter pachys TaxID=2018661 RepID=A0A2A2KFD9_9BILA|nr:hypothetical protein WR25_21104 [Diploscapter pachys]